MAHKVLSKDMSELVNSMKLAQKYNNTTVEADYRKWVSAEKSAFLIWYFQGDAFFCSRSGNGR